MNNDAHPLAVPVRSRFVPLRAALLILAPLAMPLAAQAQDVRESDSGFRHLVRAADRAAEEQNRTDWPRVIDGDTGTQAHFSVDRRNADVTLITGSEMGMTRHLTAARSVAEAAGYPRADFITFRGKRTTSVDIELNDYLEHPRRDATTFALNLGALARALEYSELPRPIVFSLDRETADRLTLETPGGTAGTPTTRTLGDRTFLALSEVPNDAVLRASVTVTWRDYLIAGGLVGMLALTLLLSLAAPWLGLRKRLKDHAAGKTAADAPAPTPDPAEVQKRYNRSLPAWAGTSAFPLLMIGASLLGNPMDALGRALTLLPIPSLSMEASMLLPAGMLPLMGLSLLASRLTERVLIRRGRLPAPADSGVPAAPGPIHPDDTPLRPRGHTAWLTGMMIILTTMPLWLFLFRSVPALQGMNLAWRLGLMFGTVALVMCVSAVISVRAAQADRDERGPGDPWHDLVREIADAAGVRVRRVVVTRSAAANASASVFGTVGLSTALLRELDRDEVRAVVAHEVGHLKARHPHRACAFSAVVLAAWLTLWLKGTPLLKPHVNEFTYVLLNGPLVGMLFSSLVAPLIAGPLHRRQERAADRLAVALTGGDPEPVVRALRRLHVVNATPHHLRPSDEAFSTHPSLAHRIEALRAPSDPVSGRG